MEFRAIQARNSRLCGLCFRHFDESKTTRLSRITVGDDVDSFYPAISGECRVKVLLGRLITEVPHKNVGHWCLILCISKFIFVRLLGNQLIQEGVAAGRHSKVNTDAGKDIYSVSELSVSCCFIEKYSYFDRFTDLKATFQKQFLDLTHIRRTYISNLGMWIVSYLGVGL